MGSWDEAAIADLLLADPVDLVLLRQISRQKGGFLSNRLRAKAWSKLLQVNSFTTDNPHVIVAAYPAHKDTEQILCDIDRSLWHFAQVANWKDEKLHRKRAQLTAVIHAVLLSNDQLHYYQGFHDVAAVFVLACDNLQQATAILEYVTQYYLIDVMRPDFKLVAQQVNLIPQLLRKLDPELYDFFVAAKVDPFFCLSWVITWFAHNIRDLETVCRLYDVFLCSQPLFVFYLSVQIIIHFRSEVLHNACEDTVVFTLFNNLPQDLPWEELIQATDDMCADFPPHTIHTIFPLAAQLQQQFSPPHLDVDSTPPDWLLLETYKMQTGKSRSGQAMKRRRALALEAEMRVRSGIESGKYTLFNSHKAVRRKRHASFKMSFPPASTVALSVAAALVAYLTISSRNNMDLFSCGKPIQHQKRMRLSPAVDVF